MLAHFPRKCQADSLNGMRVREDRWAGEEVWLMWSAHPFGGFICSGASTAVKDPRSQVPAYLTKDRKTNIVGAG